jgi:HEAT repeat protein
MLAVLALTWFVGAVVVPLWQVHQVVRRQGSAEGKAEVARLGGPDSALPKVVLYLRLTKGRSSERWRVASLLAHCGEEAIPVAIALLEDTTEDTGVRTQAAGCLGAAGDARAVEPLIRSLSDDAHYVRASAASALGEIEDGRAVGPLVAALSDWKPKGNTRVGAADQAGWALLKIGKPAVEPLLAALADAKRPDRERAHAAWILGRIGDARAREPLNALRDGDNLKLRQDARWALECLERELSYERDGVPQQDRPPKY